MELMAHILPLDIRLDKSLINTFIRILQKPESNTLRQLVVRLTNCPQHMDHRIITPIHMLKMAKRYLTTDFELTDVESQIDEHISDILRQPPLLAPFDSNLGSAGKRSDIQMKRARKIAEDFIVANIDSTIVYTDGSALGNPGPCGAGAAIFTTGHSTAPIELTRPVSKHSHSYHGELQAIELALTNLTEFHHLQGSIIILSDCQSALITASSSRTSKDYPFLQKSIQLLAATLKASGHSVLLKWVAGHTDLPGNEQADTLAKSAAREAASQQTSCKLSHTEAKCQSEHQCSKPMATENISALRQQ
jgi:ribonuclease HI